MKCAKCDICGKIVNTWKEVDFLVWKTHFDAIHVKDICSECDSKIGDYILSMIKKDV